MTYKHVTSCMIELLLTVGLLAVTLYANKIHNSISLRQCGVFWMHLLVASHKFTIKSIVRGISLCTMSSSVSSVEVVLFCNARVERDFGRLRFGLAKNVEEFICNLRWLILLLIQSVIVVKVTSVKAAATGKHQIPVEFVSLTVLRPQVPRMLVTWAVHWPMVVEYHT